MQDFFDNPTFDRSAKSLSSRKLNVYRRSPHAWMRELAKQIDEGILPPSSIDRLPMEMALRREER